MNCAMLRSLLRSILKQMLIDYFDHVKDIPLGTMYSQQYLYA